MQRLTIILCLCLGPMAAQGQIQGFESSRIHTLSQLSTIKEWVVPADSLDNLEVQIQSIPPQETTWKRSYLNVEEYKGHVQLYQRNPQEHAGEKPFSEHIFTIEQYLIVHHNRQQALVNYAGINMPFIETASRIFLQVPVQNIVEEAQKKDTLQQTENGYRLTHQVAAAGEVQLVTFELDPQFHLIKGDDGRSQVQFQWRMAPKQNIQYAERMVMTVSQGGRSLYRVETVHDVQFNGELPGDIFKMDYPDNYRSIDLRKLLHNPNLKPLQVPKPSQN